MYARCSMSVCVVAALLLVAAVRGHAEGGNAYLSPEYAVMDGAGKRLYVACVTDPRIVVLDVAKGESAGSWPLPGPPGGIAISRDGARLYVPIAVPDGRVCVVNAGSGAIERKVRVGHTPVAPVLAPDGAVLYVCNRFDATVSIIDLTTGAQTGCIAVAREPIAAAITPDGACLVVAHLVPAGADEGHAVAAAVTLIDVQSKTATSVSLPNGATSVRGLCISPDGRYAYVTHILARYRLPTTQLERGWMNTNALSVIDLGARTLVNTVLLDDVDYGAANPWGVACSGDGKYLCVAHAGTHEISVIDLPALHDKLLQAAQAKGAGGVPAEEVPNELSFLVGLRRRVPLEGLGPRGIAVSDAKVYAAEHFSDSVGVASLDPNEHGRPRSIPLGGPAAQTPERRGELLFHDARPCFQHWQSCSSCHPDVRVDGLSWDLLNDGLGNPKNTKSLLLVHQTPPSMSLGARESAPVAVRAGIRHILFASLPEEDASAIDAFLKSLRPVASPRLVDGQLSESAVRGAAVFDKAKCADCHSGALYTDLKSYDTGTASGIDAGKPFDTPTLVEVWRTAPYLHDGRAASIRDVLTKCNDSDKHGVTSSLSGTDLDDLAEFVLSL